MTVVSNLDMDSDIVDFTGDFANCLVAQAKGAVMAIVRKINPCEAAKHRLDGKRAGYQLEIRYLSREARPGTDDYACVESGPFIEYWQAKELPTLHKALKRGKEFNLFKAIHVF